MRIELRNRIWVRSGAALAVVLMLSACSWDLGNRIFSRSVDDVAITDEWIPANIILGDPQVFTRATLLNDRRREQRFIQDLIRESRNQRFEPQLQRDLRTLSIATAQLGVSLDPAERANYQREGEISELEHEVNKRRLQAEIARLDAQIERIRDQAAAEVPLPAKEVDLTQSALQAPSGDPSADATGLLTKLESGLDEILKDVGGTDGRVATSDATASPEDTFRDLQAYRGLLRAYEASNSLDDTHDLGGNTFYRVQFRATVNPGSVRDRFGVMEVMLANPTMTDKDIAQLYWTWLAYVTRQLNQANAVNLTTFNLFPEDDKLFGIVDTGLSSNGKAVRMAVPPTLESVFRDAFESLDRARGPGNKLRQLNDGIRYLGKVTGFEETAGTCPVPKSDRLMPRNARRLFPKYDELAGAYIRNFSAFAVMLSNLIDLSHSSEIDVSIVVIESALDLHRQAYVAAQEYVRKRVETLETEQMRRESGGTNANHTQAFKTRLSTCKGHFAPTNSENADPIPPKFGEILRADEDPTVRVLDVKPAERAQRVSTLASAAASLQTALSIAAALPTAGIGINAGFSNLKSEIGKIEARERVPLVVGFVEGGRMEQVPQSAPAGESKGTSSHRPGSGNRPPRFGWVLGPPLKPDLSGSRLTHSQMLKSHEVQVDLSLPAWWPWVELSFRTAWAGPLGTSVEGACTMCEERTFKVALPLSDSDMDALTRYLVSGLSVSHPIAADRSRFVSDRPRIVNVSPRVIDRSAGRPVALIVQGAGLWRGEEVFVYGVQQTDVRVLADMSGVAVTVDPSRLPRLNPKAEIVPLVVFTRTGKAQFRELTLVESQVASASGLALVPVIPYHINNMALRLRPRTGSFPLGTSPRIAFRPSVEGQNYEFMEAKAKLTASRSVASATVNWTGGVEMVSGNTLGVSYLYRPDENSAPIWSDEVFLVYYKDKNEAAATFDKADVVAGSTASVRVALKLPKRAADAYPLILDGETEVEATAGTAALVRNGGMLEVNLTPPAEGFAKGAITLRFTNPKAGTGALPEINGTLTVK